MNPERTDAASAEFDVIDALMDCYNPAPLRNSPPADRWEDANKDETGALRLPVCCYDD